MQIAHHQQTPQDDPRAIAAANERLMKFLTRGAWLTAFVTAALSIAIVFTK
ncbi:hypothetical protein [Burkholderia gladioli]|uniref:hypothetical protein n=1 Tax=Burkholderia gladioli TaxID=28095 RepID=UPI00163F7229|nr:hypothetical protein [Burkholderia gladioli]